MKEYLRETKEVLAEYGSSRTGLNSSQVAKNLEKYGKNELYEEKKRSIFIIFLSQFADVLVAILIISAIISLITGNVTSTVVILVVITMNAVLGTIQHVKASHSLESLKALSSPQVSVRRDGQMTKIDATEIVAGDILCIEAGDMASADGRILEASALLVNESALTGESLGVYKSSTVITSEEDIPLGDRTNMIYSGSAIANGRGEVVVTAVGMQTELGKIANLMNNAKRKKTPLQENLDKFSTWLSIGIMVICALVMILSIFVSGRSIMDSLLFAVALAVAAIPEALSSIITISLAIGTQKMVRENAIIRDLKAVEGLGCVSVVCSDKTGTLTMNRMTVRDIYNYGDMEEIYNAMSLCNDGNISNNNGEMKTYGDPTETALLSYIGLEECCIIREKNRRIADIPFDSDRKLMSSLNNTANGTIMYTKGAPDVLLSRADKIYEDGETRELTDDDREVIRKKNDEYSEQGMRVLAFSMKYYGESAQNEVSTEDIDLEDENNLIFIGLVAMTDPPREESKIAVEQCISAGIKPIMITGDHKVTARAIAKEIGIYNDGDICLEGSEISAYSDEGLTEILPKVSVYARVSPSDKIRIVDLWQRLGHIVSMTGDGVNDAPALKKADIGVAMGITGTEVSKDAAAMVIADDNFATIVKAVANGRGIYNNIISAIKFLLCGNLAGILVVLVTSILNMPIPFSAVHLLFINLLTDSLPAIALSMEPLSRDVLKKKPRSSTENILNKSTLSYICIHGVMLATATFAAYMIGCEVSDAAGQTMAFATLCLGRLFEGFDCRGVGSLLKLKLTTNKFSLLAFFGGFVCLALAMFVPVLAKIMGVAKLEGEDVLIIVALAILPFMLTQIKRIIMEDHAGSNN